MLNRTNRTLSANTNRLNLGTRMLDLNASANNGSLTLRTAHTPAVVTVRTGFGPYPGFMFAEPSILEPKPLKPVMPPTVRFIPRVLEARPGLLGLGPRADRPVTSSQPAQPGPVLRDVVGTGRRVAPPVVTPAQSHARSSLAWHCDRLRLAGRSARAALALVTEVAST